MRLRWVLVFFAAPLLFSQARSPEQRALEISEEIAGRSLPFGSILDPIYASASSNAVVGYTRCGDSAIWTGHYLAAESLRYSVTKSATALEAVRRALAGVRALVEVTAPSNILARCIVRADSPYAAGVRNEEQHNGSYPAKLNDIDYYWIGRTSRDQYLGIFFGLSVAHERVDDTAIKASVADVATRLLERLLEKNWAIVMPNGSISTVFWLRPDQQLAILQVGRQVNPTRFGQRYVELRREATGLKSLMEFEALDTHNSYFKFNLDAITWYMLLRFEEPGSEYRQNYLDAYTPFRRTVEGHGNAFFNVIDLALRGPNGKREAETLDLLDQWLQRPRRDDRVDLRGKYSACGDDRSCMPIPVVERVRTDFLWQRSPFLLYGGGSGLIEGPGIDFILPYWMGRAYGSETGLAATSAAAPTAGIAVESVAVLHGSNFKENPSVSVVDALGTSRTAEVISATPDEILFQVPAGTALGQASILIEPGRSTTVEILSVAPALFSANRSGKGPASGAAVRIDPDGARTPVEIVRCVGSVCTLQEIELGETQAVYLSLHGTGIRGRSNLDAVRAVIGGESLPVLYAGPMPGYPGSDQVNVLLPLSLRGTGESAIYLVADGVSSNAVTIRIK